MHHEPRATFYTALSCLLLVSTVLWVDHSFLGPPSASLSLTTTESLVIPLSDSSFEDRAIFFGKSDGLSKTTSLSFHQDIVSTKDQTLLKRELTFNDARCRGERLLALLAGPGIPSQFTSFDDLEKNGWNVPEGPGPGTLYVEPDLIALGRWHPDAKFTESIMSEHDSQYLKNGVLVVRSFPK